MFLHCHRSVSLPWCFGLLLFSSVVGARAFSIASDGEVSAPIVLGNDPCPASLHTAEVLQEVLGRITGAAFSITTGDGSTGMAVGMASEFPALADDQALKLKERFAPTDLATRQSYVLRSHASGVQIIADSEIGVIYGGWDFLYRLGYRQFFPRGEWEVVPDCPDAAIDVDVFEKPNYILRHIAGSVSPDWCLRNRVSPVLGWKEAKALPYLPKRWTSSMVQNYHNWGAIIEHSKAEFDAHPEYLGLVTVKADDLPPPPEPGEADSGAKRNDDPKLALDAPSNGTDATEATVQKRVSSKLCVSNPRVLELAARYAIDYFRKDPEQPSVSMEPTDGGNWCECAECAEIGPPSERVALLANYVAKALEQEFPDKYVGILAYYTHADPPKRKLHPRVVVSLATALSGSTPLEERLDGWAKVCDNLGVYEYLSVMEWHLGLPAKSLVSNLPYLTKTIPFYYEKNVRFFTGQATGGAWGGHGLGYYVLSRLLWDVGEAEHVQAIVDDFLQRAFGDAAEPMREYYHVIDGSQQKPGSGAFFLDRATRMYAALRAAKQATSDPAVHKRLNQLVLYTRYVELFGHEAEARRSPEHYPALVRLVRFAYRIRDEGIVGGYGMLRGYLDGARAVPVRPKLPQSTTELTLDEPEPTVPYVDRPITEDDIRAILDGTAVIPTPDTEWPDAPKTDTIELE